MKQLLISSNPSKTVLCIGHITPKRKRKFLNNESQRLKYISTMKRRVVQLMTEGFDSFLFITWGEFDLLLLNVLKEIDSGFGCTNKSYIPMAVFKKLEENEMPSPDEHFQFIIDLDEEKMNLTPDQLKNQILNNVSSVLCDKTEANNQIWDYLKKAKDAGKEFLYI